MSKKVRKSDEFWEKAFEEYRIKEEIQKKNYFSIDESMIKNGLDKTYEPRLVTKFDTRNSLPNVFKVNNDVKYSILPYRNSGEYIIVNNDVYHTIDVDFKLGMKINRIQFPENIISMNVNEITSEANAINAALISGMFSDFFNVDEFYAPVSGRRRSKSWQYKLGDSQPVVEIISTQMEIDGTLESENMIVVIEAKNKLNDDFLIRQLYYPFRDFHEQFSKKKEIKTVFLVYNAGVYTVMEYKFSDPSDMLSIELVKVKHYVLGNLITREDVVALHKKTKIEIAENNVPFPQANNLFKILNSLELISKSELEEPLNQIISSEYDMDIRQGDYYLNALRFLGLVDKTGKNKYVISPVGKRYLRSNFEKKLKIIIEQLLHEPTINKIIKDVIIEQKQFDIETYKLSLLNKYKMTSLVTVERRLQTIKTWIEWVNSIISK